ncbi:hypothetical protein ACHQM5_001937 [Ranunculus cassubicifolius]
MAESFQHSILEDEVSDDQKGGLKTMPFIIVSVLSIWSAASDFLAICGAFISDSYLGKFRVIIVGSFITVIGMTLLWLTAMVPQARPSACNPSSSECQSSTFSQQAFLLSSLGLISLGGGCIKPCSMAFGADQFMNRGNSGKNDRLVQSYFNWYYAFGSISSVIALTVIVYIQDHLGWKVGFGVPAILMLLSTLFFMVGSPLYVKMKAHNSLLTGLAQVPVAAFRNRHLVIPPDNSDGLYCQGRDSNFIVPSDKLSFLNKACIVKHPEEDFNDDDSVAKPWDLCTIDQVETIKALIYVIPIWSTGIIIYTVINQTSITVVQATTMDRHVTVYFQIPAGSFALFVPLSVAIWMAVYDRVVIPLIAKCTGRSSGLSTTSRIGIGIFVACLAMAVASAVESFRRKIAIEEGLMDDPLSVVRMSAMWLIPQYCLSGIAVGVNGVGQMEYYYSHLPKSISSIAMAIYTLGTACSGLVGSLITTVVNDVTKSRGEVSWLSANPNEGHYDYYYGLLSILCLLNFVYFLICSGAYGPCKNVSASTSGEKEELKETLLPLSKELPSTSSA